MVVPFYEKRLAYWLDRLPHNIAVEQAAWERRRYAKGLRDSGLTYPEIAEKLGTSTNSARVCDVSRAKERSPAYSYLNSGCDIESVIYANGKRRVRNNIENVFELCRTLRGLSN